MQQNCPVWYSWLDVYPSVTFMHIFIKTLETTGNPPHPNTKINLLDNNFLSVPEYAIHGPLSR